jgi:hypothetical protein
MEYETLKSTPVNIIKVYAKIDANGLLIEEPQSSSFIQDVTGWTQIDECPLDADQDTREKYHFAQKRYLIGPAKTQEGISRFRWDGEKVLERSAEEIAADVAALLPPPQSEEDKMKFRLQAVEQAFLTHLLKDMGGLPL